MFEDEGMKSYTSLTRNTRQSNTPPETPKFIYDLSNTHIILTSNISAIYVSSSVNFCNRRQVDRIRNVLWENKLFSQHRWNFSKIPVDISGIKFQISQEITFFLLDSEDKRNFIPRHATNISYLTYFACNQCQFLSLLSVNIKYILFLSPSVI